MPSAPASNLNNPYADAESDSAEFQASIQRGADTYRVFCTSCHGASGTGDGPVTKRGFPPPPSLLTGNSLEDGGRSTIPHPDIRPGKYGGIRGSNATIAALGRDKLRA